MINTTSISNRTRAALVLDGLSIQHKVTFGAEEALIFAQYAESHGATAEDLTGLIESINKVIPPMNFGWNNPNNGNPHHEFIIGKEYSRVLYLRVVKIYLPKNYNLNGLFSILKELGRDFHADGNDLQENETGSFLWRFWWD